MTGLPDDDAAADLPRSRDERLQAARAARLAERQAMVDQLRAAMPPAMAALPQWLLWRMEEVPNRTKPAKVPYYASGQRRRGEMGTPQDRAALVPLDVALQRLLRGPQWSGLGFAFLAGDGLIGIDVDHAVDAATGEPSDLCRLVVDSCDSYTELSPSGTGVHVIVAGECETFKDDALGLEVYAGARYFTCTGRPVGWAATPPDVQPVDPAVLAYLRELVDESRERQRAARAAAVAPAPAEAPALSADAPAPAPPAPPAPTQQVRPPAPAPAAPAGHGGGADFKRVNDAAMMSLHKWVPTLLPEAQERGKGYRVTSKALGRQLQEDLSILPSGIVDFGVHDLGDAREGKRSPVDLVMEWGSRVGVAADKPAEALRWLAQQLGMPLARPALRRVVAAQAAEPPAGEGAAPGREARPRAPRQGKGADGPGEDQPARGGPDAADDGPIDDEADGAADGGSSGRGKIPPEVWAKVDAMIERYALVYGTDTAWDRLKLKLVRIPALRLAIGSLPVKLWLAHDARAMIDPEDLVFEPDEDVQPPRVNMWAGLDMQPVPCEPADVDVMLQLLRHLCSETRIIGADGVPVPSAVDDVMHWVLCWLALPLQRPGTKLATALVMHGAQGTGKNLFFDAWRDLYGTYGITVTQTELEDKYNGWISRKMAVVGDEVVSRAEMYHNKNRLKLIVTQRDKFAIRDLFTATRWESNHANVVFLSNESEPLVLEDRDRRFLVTYTPLEAPAELYQRVRDFLADGGLAKWLDYLLRYDLTGFDAHTKPPFTEAKRALIEANWRPAVRFVYEWLEGLLELPVRVCSVEQIYKAFRRWCDQTGERWPPSQPKFTAEINRWVSESRKRGPDGQFPPPRLTYKVIGLAETATQRKSTRCFVPRDCRPEPGVTEGAWAWDAVRAFDHDLWVFLGRRPAMDDDKGAA